MCKGKIKYIKNLTIHSKPVKIGFSPFLNIRICYIFFTVFARMLYIHLFPEYYAILILSYN